MRTVALALALLCSTARADAPRRAVLEVRSGILTRVDGSTVAVGEGVYLAHPDAIAAGREVVELRTRVASLEAGAPSGPSVVVVVVAIVAAVAAGVVVGRVTAR